MQWWMTSAQWDCHSAPGILSVPLKRKRERNEKKKAFKKRKQQFQHECFFQLDNAYWLRSEQKNKVVVNSYISVSAREVDMIRYFYSITFQDAVEKIIDNLSLTRKPQDSFSWSCFSPHHMNKQKWSQEARRNADHPKTTWLISVSWIHSIANSLIVKPSLIHSSTRGTDCLLFAGFSQCLILWRSFLK